MATENYTSNHPQNNTYLLKNYTTTDYNVDFGLHVIDAVIVILYLVFSTGLGLYLSRRHSSAEDYFLASRSTLWPFVGLSLFASNISSSSLVGLAGDAYSSGISVYNYEWMAAVILVIFGTFYVPTILRSNLYTMPEFLEKRFSAITRCYFSILTIFLNIIADTAAGLYAGALVIRMVFPQLEIWHTIAILAVVAGVYTVSGGLAAVIYTDALQAVTLLLGSILISVFTLIEAGGWSNVKEHVPAAHLSLIRPATDSAVPWTGLITGLPILGFYFWCTNQTIAQRVLSSKDVNHGRWGCLLAGLLKLPVLFIMVLPGTMAIVLYPNLPRGDLVYPTLMFRLLPVGILGLVLSGFIAALMSQIDSTLNSASTLVTIDFIKKFKPDLTDKQLMYVGRFVTFLFMLVSVAWAPLLEMFGSLFQYFQKILSYLIPPVAALYIGGFFWKGANARGAILTLILGNVWGVALFVIVEILGWIKFHFLHAAAVLFVLSLLLLIGVSFSNGKTCTEEQLKITWSISDFIEDTMVLKELPPWKNYLVYSLLLLISAAVIVGCFW